MRFLTVLLVAAQLGFVSVAEAQKHSGNWVATWATAEMLVHAPRPQTAAPPPQNAPAGAAGFNNQTVRMALRASIGGPRLRIKISNAFGSAPLEVGAAHIALRGKDSETVAGSDHAIMFAGKPRCTIGPGIVITSDPVEMKIDPLTDLSVSLYFPGETGPPTNHATALHGTYIKDGDVTAETAMPDARRTEQYYFLSAVDVDAPAGAAAIVTLGDSITDGARSTSETNHSWPTLLAARLAADKSTARFGVANVGIGGNRILRDISGASALARFDRDVLSQSGVQWVMFLEGINDIGHGNTEPVTADELIAGHKQIIEMAHAHGIKAIGCTLTPYEGAGYSREEGEAIREALNTWIRTSGAYDAIADFDAAVRDPEQPRRIRADFDPGDHLHPNNAGYEAMANAVDLAIFGGKPAKTSASKRK
jgi:lysophospholipase L1-like esterase